MSWLWLVPLLMFIPAHYADLLVQGDTHGWNVLPAWWDRTRRTTGWIPRDHWHKAQATRNWLWVIGTVVTPYLITLEWYIVVPLAWVMWLVGRGIGWGIPKKLSRP